MQEIEQLVVPYTAVAEEKRRLDVHKIIASGHERDLLSEQNHSNHYCDGVPSGFSALND